ncbi:MAG: AbiV family abortive infection protein [Candidatus Acidiferrales bacterium]
MSPSLRDESLLLYHCAHNNAVELLEEAEILFAKGAFPRAYALAFTALEEIAKSQLAADVFTGHITEDEFHDHYRDHKKKIGRMAWATEDARRYLDGPEGDYVDVEVPTFSNRMDAMYVSINNGNVKTPADVIDSKAAQGIIHTVKVAFERIFEMTEFWGHQIGTKGFMK